MVAPKRIRARAAETDRGPGGPGSDYHTKMDGVNKISKMPPPQCSEQAYQSSALQSIRPQVVRPLSGIEIADGPSRCLRILAGAIVLIATLIYVGVIGCYVCAYHDGFNTQAFDLGIFDQALWLVSHGQTPFVTVRGLHRFGDHVEYLLYLLAPLYWVWDHVHAALIAQTFAIALGAPAVFLIARRRIGYVAGILFALVYLANPSVLNLNLDHVHAEAFGATALLFAYYFAIEGRFGWMLLLCMLAMSCKEDVAITTSAFALYVAWRWGRRRKEMRWMVLILIPIGIYKAQALLASPLFVLGDTASVILALMAIAVAVHLVLRKDRMPGLGLFILSVAYFLLCMYVLLPYYNGFGFFRTSSGWFAGWAANKWKVTWYWEAFTQREVFLYLLGLLMPLAFLPLLAPGLLFVAVPAILINLLTVTDYMRSINYHYMASITPFLFAGAIEGAALLANRPLFLPIPFLSGGRNGHSVRVSLSVSMIGPILPRSLVRVGVLGVVLFFAWKGNHLEHWHTDRQTGQTKVFQSCHFTWLEVQDPPSGAEKRRGIGASISRLRFTGLHKMRDEVERSRTDPAVQAAREALACIPAEAVVSADYLVTPHLTHRKRVYMFPNPFEPDNWGIADENMHDPADVQYIVVGDNTLDSRKWRILNDLTRSKQFGKIYGRYGISVYKRDSTPPSPFAERPAGMGLLGVFYRYNMPLLSLPEWKDRVPAFKALFPTVDFPPTTEEFISADGHPTGMFRQFVAVFDGFILLPATGTYEFIVYSDDGFKLTIGGKLIGECDKLHAFAATRMSADLTEGISPIQLAYFENDPPHGLRLFWRIPGTNVEEIIPAAALHPSKEAAQHAANQGSLEAQEE
jgi:uncharacterized membrane protein